jgi:hypothetical protein
MHLSLDLLRTFPNENFPSYASLEEVTIPEQFA